MTTIAFIGLRNKGGPDGRATSSGWCYHRSGPCRTLHDGAAAELESCGIAASAKDAVAGRRSSSPCRSLAACALASADILTRQPWRWGRW